MLLGETGNPAVTGDGGVAVYVVVGEDPCALAAAGAEAVMRHLGTGKLRREKFLCRLQHCRRNVDYSRMRKSAGLKHCTGDFAGPRRAIEQSANRSGSQFTHDFQARLKIEACSRAVLHKLPLMKFRNFFEVSSDRIVHLNSLSVSCPSE